MVIGLNLVNFAEKNIGGAGYFAKRLFEVLSEIKGDRQFVAFIQDGLEPSSFHLDKLNCKVIKVGNFSGKSGRILFEQFILPFKLEKYDIEVLICPSVSVPLLTSKKIKIITVIHDLLPFKIKFKYGRIQNLYIKWITKKSAKRADHVIAVSQNTKEDLISVLNIPQNKISIVYNFIPGKKLNFLDQKENFFISVNQIDPSKNLERAFEAFKIFLKEAKEDYKFYIIGKNGWNSEVIYNKVKELKLENNILFTGYVEEEKLHSFYQNCTGLIYVSLYEGFGIPPLELMYYGKPSVVSNNSSLPEVVGQAGVLVDPYNVDDISDGIKKITELKFRESIKQFIPYQLKKFDPRLNVVKLIRIIDDLNNEY